MKTLAMFAFVVAGVMLAQKPAAAPNREAVHQSRPSVDADEERQVEMDAEAERDQEQAARDQEQAERDQEQAEQDQRESQ